MESKKFNPQRKHYLLPAEQQRVKFTIYLYLFLWERGNHSCDYFQIFESLWRNTYELVCRLTVDVLKDMRHVLLLQFCTIITRKAFSYSCLNNSSIHWLCVSGSIVILLGRASVEPAFNLHEWSVVLRTMQVFKLIFRLCVKASNWICALTFRIRGIVSDWKVKLFIDAVALRAFLILCYRMQLNRA
jgi:hypothetical protein